VNIYVSVREYYTSANHAYASDRGCSTVHNWRRSYYYSHCEQVRSYSNSTKQTIFAALRWMLMFIERLEADL
jgi:hypothetical protein